MGQESLIKHGLMPKKPILDDQSFCGLRLRLKIANSLEELPKLKDDFVLTRDQLTQLRMISNPFVQRFFEIIKEMENKVSEYHKSL